MLKKNIVQLPILHLSCELSDVKFLTSLALKGTQNHAGREASFLESDTKKNCIRGIERPYTI